MKSRHGPGLPIILALLLAGCVAAPRPEVGAPAVTVAGEDVTADFRIQGRIAVRGASKAFSASFDWRQAGDHYAIDFWGPLGQGRMRVHGDAASASVTDSRGRVTDGVHPQALLQRELGWTAPLDALRFWVRGQHAPAAAVRAEQRDAAGRPASFEQFGWSVELSRWRTVDAGAVPEKVVATRGDNRVAVVCRDWWLGA